VVGGQWVGCWPPKNVLKCIKMYKNVLKCRFLKGLLWSRTCGYQGAQARGRDEARRRSEGPAPVIAVRVCSASLDHDANMIEPC
jgi:hypothetical protein